MNVAIFLIITMALFFSIQHWLLPRFHKRDKVIVLGVLIVTYEFIVIAMLWKGWFTL